MANTTASIWKTLKDRADSTNAKLIKDQATRDAYEANANGEIARKANNEKGLEDIFNSLTGVINQHEVQYNETAGIIREQNERRISSAVINNFNTEMDGAHTEKDIIAIKTKYDKQIKENSDAADDQYKPLWEVTGQTTTAAFTKRQVSIQQTEALNTINLAMVEAGEAWKNHPSPTMAMLEKAEMDLKGVIPIVQKLGGNTEGIYRELAEIRKGKRGIETAEAFALGEQKDTLKIQSTTPLAAFHEVLGSAKQYAEKAITAEGITAYYYGDKNTIKLPKSREKLWANFVKDMKAINPKWKVPAGPEGEKVKEMILKELEAGLEVGKKEADGVREVSRRDAAGRSPEQAESDHQNWRANVEGLRADGLNEDKILNITYDNFDDTTFRGEQDLLLANASDADMIKYYERREAELREIIKEFAGVGRLSAEVIEDWEKKYGSKIDGYKDKIEEKRSKAEAISYDQFNKRSENNQSEYAAVVAPESAVPKYSNAKQTNYRLYAKELENYAVYGAASMYWLDFNGERRKYPPKPTDLAAMGERVAKKLKKLYPHESDDVLQSIANKYIREQHTTGSTKMTWEQRVYTKYPPTEEEVAEDRQARIESGDILVPVLDDDGNAKVGGDAQPLQTNITDFVIPNFSESQIGEGDTFFDRLVAMPRNDEIRWKRISKLKAPHKLETQYDAAWIMGFTDYEGIKPSGAKIMWESASTEVRSVIDARNPVMKQYYFMTQANARELINKGYEHKSDLITTLKRKGNDFDDDDGVALPLRADNNGVLSADNALAILQENYPEEVPAQTKANDDRTVVDYSTATMTGAKTYDSITQWVSANLRKVVVSKGKKLGDVQYKAIESRLKNGSGQLVLHDVDVATGKYTYILRTENGDLIDDVSIVLNFKVSR